MLTSKICPMLYGRPEVDCNRDNHLCGSDCAWWVSGTCAVVLLAQAAKPDKSDTKKRGPEYV